MGNKTVTHAEIMVLGAGIIGLIAAITFAQQGRKVVLVDSKIKPKVETKKQVLWDTRIYALTPVSVDWLKQIGVWQHADASKVTAISGMQLWHTEDSTPLNLMADDANILVLGYIVENQNLLIALMEQIKALAIECIQADFEQLRYQDGKVLLHLGDDIVSASLLIAADGVNSPIRQWLALPTTYKDFEQTAIVANFLAGKPHGNIARQWFSSHETLALLPLPNQYVSMVWSLPNSPAADLLKLTPETLAMRVIEASKHALGELQVAGEVMSFPLQQITAKQLIAERIVLMGDAAHQIHPMAGQGLNLGLRDIIALAAFLKKTHTLQDIGEKSFLRQYERSRKTDITSMNMLTSGLDALFALDQSQSHNIAGWGLRHLNTQPALKKWLIQQATA